MTQPSPDRHATPHIFLPRGVRALLAGAGLVLAGLVLAGPLYAQDDAGTEGTASEQPVAGAGAAAEQASARTAEEALEDPRTIATVGGEPITDADVAMAAGDLADTIGQYPDEQKAGILVNFLINQKLMAQAAEKRALQETAEFKERMALLRDRTLRDLYFEQSVRDEVSEEQVRKAYDETAGKVTGEEEVRARHILVETEEAAEAIIEELEGGADFATLAEEKSTGPSGENGGDVGFFGKGDMVAAFAEAAFALEEGAVSEPVETEFGWHVIKLEERRAKSPPPFEQVQQQIVDNLVRTRYFELIEELKQDTEIKIFDEGGAEIPMDEDGAADGANDN